MAASGGSRTRNISESEGSLSQEIELLEAIYIHELTVDKDKSGRPCCLSVVLHPATAEDTTTQYVCITLVLQLPNTYPHQVPEILIRNSRGLADEQLMGLRKNLHELADERKGGAMLYELIELAKESLTSNNLPSVVCLICLYELQEEDDFIKTACYHYFHSHCLANYIEHAEKEEEKVVCLVCRESLSYDLEQLKKATTPKQLLENEAYKPSAEVQAQQKKMEALYKKQMKKGAIIDVEAEKNKFLIDISATPDITVTVSVPKTHPSGVDRADQVANTDASDTERKTDASLEKTKDKSSTSKRADGQHPKREDGRYDRRSHHRRQYHDRDRPRSGKYDHERSDRRSRAVSARDDRFRKEGNKTREDSNQKSGSSESGDLQKREASKKETSRQGSDDKAVCEKTAVGDGAQGSKCVGVTAKEGGYGGKPKDEKQVNGEKERSDADRRDRPGVGAGGRRYHQPHRGRGGGGSGRPYDGTYRQDSAQYHRQRRERYRDRQGERNDSQDGEVHAGKMESGKKDGNDKSDHRRRKDHLDDNPEADAMSKGGERDRRSQSGRDSRNKRSIRPPPGFQQRKPPTGQQSHQPTGDKSQGPERHDKTTGRGTKCEKSGHKTTAASSDGQKKPVKCEPTSVNGNSEKASRFGVMSSERERESKPIRKPPGFEGKHVDNKDRTVHHNKPVKPPPGFDDFR